MVNGNQYTKRAGASTLASLAKAIDGGIESLESAGVDLTDEQWHDLRRAALVASHANVTMHGIDAQLLPLSLWDQVEAEETSTLNEITTLAADGMVGRIETIAAGTDRVVQLLQIVPASPRARKTESAAAASQDLLQTVVELEDSAKRIVKEAEDSMVERVGKVESNLAMSVSELSDRVQALRTALDGLENSIAANRTASDETTTTLKDEIAREEARLVTLHSDWTNRFQAAVDKGKTDVDEVREAGKEGFRDQLDSQSRAWQLEAAQRTSQIEAQLDYFAEQHARVNTILGVTAASETAGTYLEEARQQKREADRWRVVAALAFVVAGVIAVWQAVTFPDAIAGLSAAELGALTAVRTATAGVALSGAAWLTAQVSHHRKREQEARRMASELTAFRPFIAELDDPSDEIRGAVGRYFPGHGLDTKMPDEGDAANKH